jgi:hypothetical protein
MSGESSTPEEGLRLEHSPLLGPRADRHYQGLAQHLHVAGDVAECGVYRGETAREMARYLRFHRIAKRVHLFDGFTGLPDLVTAEEKEASCWKELGPGHYASTLEEVMTRIQDLDCLVHPGRFSDTLPKFTTPLCFIHCDGDLYQSTVEVIEFARRLLTPGGAIVFDDYGNPRLPGVKFAVDRHLDPATFRILPSNDTIQCLAARRGEAS